MQTSTRLHSAELSEVCRAEQRESAWERFWPSLRHGLMTNELLGYKQNAPTATICKWLWQKSLTRVCDLSHHLNPAQQKSPSSRQKTSLICLQSGSGLNLLHKEVGWTSKSVVRILHHGRRSACIWVAQIIGHVIRMEVSVNRMERHVQAFRRTLAACSILARHWHSSRRIPAVTHWTFVTNSTVTAVASAAWALRSHGWRSR